MKIAFFGATQFSYQLLELLLNRGFNICKVFTLPKRFEISYSDRPVKIFNYSDIAGLAKKNSIPLKVIKGKMCSYVKDIQDLSPDLILVLGWYFMIPKNIREIAPKGCIGIHASLLPTYAGGAPLVWAMINGEKKAGVSLFYFEDGVDTGDIIAQKSFLIGKTDTIKTVYDKATQASKTILLEYLPKIESGKAPRFQQDLSLRTEFPQRSPKDGLINWDLPAEKIRDFIRAQTRPYPGAFSIIDDKKITIWDADATNDKRFNGQVPGKIVYKTKRFIVVSTGLGQLKVIDFERRKG